MGRFWTETSQGAARFRAGKERNRPEINAFEKISNAYYSLTAAEKKVADYVIIHQQESQYMSISELAEACGVAEATVSRFSKRLGYKGYNAFKLAAISASRAVIRSTMSSAGSGGWYL